MPARIYALAKELKIDSGELSEICSKAGITGKGSALASLSDDEVTKLKEYIAGGGKNPAAASPVAADKIQGQQKPGAPIRREDYVAPAAASGKPGSIGSIKKPEESKPPKKTGNEQRTSKNRPAPAIKLAPMPTVDAHSLGACCGVWLA